jgi:glycosyltransferase involved in cell wall biosynthesis
MKHQTPTPVAVSVVVIGRNEGTRLQRCLHSVRQSHWGDTQHELIYVDSRSSDDSVASAKALGAQVIELIDASPCAAKARNLGWQAARGAYVLFLDGDTELHPEFVSRALSTLAEPKLCAAWGHRRESCPQQSLYTRVLDLDWVYPTGRTLYFGGDVLVRRAALAQVDGFDPSLKAGEEPELCARLRAAGWEIEHIDEPMTLHDLAVTSLRAYWLRAYRSGIAYAEVAERMRLRGDVLWQHEARRDFRHGLLFCASPVLLLGALCWQPALALTLLTLALVYLLRTALRCAWKAPGQWSLCAQYAVHAHFQKIPALFGQLKWRQAVRQQSEIALVDYKK